ncbi:MAG: SpoIIE family protein phosphatase [Phycisphaerae bacterium]|nr:SpoIIE family protein phosphatase [Phycisphaerae bacterium]
MASASDGITISDPSFPDNPLIYVNSGFEAITGYTAEDVLGKNCRFLQGPQTGQPASEEIRRAIAEDRPCVVELLNYRKDGSTFWNRLSITPIRDVAGKTTHYIGVLSDITRRREAEDSLRHTNERLAAANTEMKRAFDYAARIQQSLLPARPLHTERCQVLSKLIACEELAGDTLNYFVLDEHCVGFYLLDVVGHGVPAAMLSVTINHLLSPRSGKSCLFESAGPQQTAVRVLSPAQVGRMLNEMFSDNIGSGLFFTIFYGVWNASTEKLTYVSAGHPPSVLLRADGEVQLLDGTGFPVGVTQQPDYQDHTLTFGTGDRLFVYSDGLTEAADKHEEHFGVERLMALVEEGRQRPLKSCLDEIMEKVERFQQKAASKDDLSLLAFEVTT